MQSVPASGTYALVDALGSIHEFREFRGDPPQFSPDKPLRWVRVVDTRPVLLAGEELVGPIITLTASAVERVWVTRPAPPPAAVTPYQARLALARAGLLSAVEAAVQTAGAEAAMAWEYAVVIEHRGALVSQIAAALGLTDGQVDDLFRVAGSIEA